MLIGLTWKEPARAGEAGSGKSAPMTTAANEWRTTPPEAHVNPPELT